MHLYSASSILAILFVQFASRQSAFELCFHRAFWASDRVYPSHKALLEPPDEVESQDIILFELEREVTMFWPS
jgi:hypothetical protein